MKRKRRSLRRRAASRRTRARSCCGGGVSARQGRAKGTSQQLWPLTLHRQWKPCENPAARVDIPDCSGPPYTTGGAALGAALARKALVPVAIGQTDLPRPLPGRVCFISDSSFSMPPVEPNGRALAVRRVTRDKSSKGYPGTVPTEACKVRGSESRP